MVIQTAIPPSSQPDLKDARNPWRHKIIQHHYPNPYLQNNAASTPVFTCPDLRTPSMAADHYQIFKKSAEKPVLLASGSYQNLPKVGMLIHLPTQAAQMQMGPKKPSTCEGEGRPTMHNR